MTELAGVPDGYQRLWTPHRVAYIGGDKKPTTGEAHDCPFCAAPGGEDSETLIVHRSDHVYALLNLFPYNSGHVLVCTYRHVAQYVDLTDEERNDMALVTRDAIHALTTAYAPHGFNLGMNQGDVAGAGIAAHIHQHIVPRWQGDANFFPIVGQTKALPYLLADTRDQLAQAWPKENTDAE